MFIVLDTNVIVSALCSSKGASFALIQAMPTPKFTPVLSVTLWTEYQDIVKRATVIPQSISEATRGTICNWVLVHAKLQRVYYRWRVQLPDPGDAHVLEVAVAGQADYIVTHNLKDFRAARDFGITAVTPGEFIQIIGGLP